MALFVTGMLALIAPPRLPAAELGANQEWKDAERKWTEFSEEYLERMRRLDSEIRAKRPPGASRLPERKLMEIRSALLTRYLPNHRLYADADGAFVLLKNGEIRSLGGGGWSLHVERDGAYLRSPRVSELLAGQEIPVPDAGTAIDIMNLAFELSEASVNVAAFQRSTSDCQVLDRKRLGGALPRERDWKQEATKAGDRWLVMSVYVGPPADTAEPTTFVISLNPRGNVSGVFEHKARP